MGWQGVRKLGTLRRTIFSMSPTRTSHEPQLSPPTAHFNGAGALQTCPPGYLGALGRPTIGHLDPLFIELMDDTKQLLQYAFKTQNELTIPLSAPGSAGMEAAFVNSGLPG